jgi:hypothetical protein
MLSGRIIIVTILFFNTLFYNSKDSSSFISPVKIPLLLSANFGELRLDHFHSGLDIKTQGVTGKEVVAAADGYIFRIGVSPVGFGKALYIRHASGYSTVYGHLDKFTPEIEEFVKAQQYENKSYQVTLFPQRDKFPVKRGDLIAYSGNSGSSGGPHLHYEIRKSDGEIPVNPLLYEFGSKDDIKPVIEKLVIYPINRHSSVNNGQNIIRMNVSGGNGKYSLPSETVLNISGATGFGIKSYDLFNESNNKCAVYSIEMRIDSIPLYNYVMNSFAFSESRYINSHIDYETYMKDGIYIERAFVLPNDKLSTYKNIINRGIYNFNDEKTHKITIEVQDVNNNKSTLSFNVKSILQKTTESQKHSIPENPENNSRQLMPYNRSNKFITENISVNIPTGALYDTVFFSYKKTPGTKEMISDLHYINNIYTPLHKSYTLSIKPYTIPAGKESQMLIVQLGEDKKKSTFKSKLINGHLTAETQSFGRFFIGIDSVPPLISANGFESGAILTEKANLKLNISDDYSGIKSYEPIIDGKWALFEYDQKNNIIIYRFDEKRIPKGTTHSLSLKVTDNVNNVSLYNCDFTW